MSSNIPDPTNPAQTKGSPANVSGPLVQVGTVITAHGNYGKLRIAPTTSNPKRFGLGSKLQILERKYTVNESGPGPNGTILLSLEEIHTREDALTLMGEVIAVHESAVPQTAEGTYYHFQLIGLEVITSDRETIGSITEVIETGANDVYVVQTAETEWLIPAISSVIIDVNLEAGSMQVVLPAGLEVRHIGKSGTKRKLRVRTGNAKNRAG